MIDSGSDLKRWDESSVDYIARKAALEELRVQITSPQPPESKAARHVPAECHMKRGTLLAYKLGSVSRIIFRVIDRFTDLGGTYLICEILDWIGRDIPTKATLKTLSTKRTRADYKHVITQLMICGLDENSPRVQKLDFRLKPAQKDAGPTVVPWSHVDTLLAEWFLLG